MFIYDIKKMSWKRATPYTLYLLWNIFHLSLFALDKWEEITSSDNYSGDVKKKDSFFAAGHGL